MNSRTSVLAAANSVFGRWDNTKDTDENIDFQSTILSRFDLIFVVKDEYDPERDRMLAQHVMSTHFQRGTAAEAQTHAEFIPVPLFKKFVHYCRTKCGPRLSSEAAKKLESQFVLIRQEARDAEKERDGRRAAIPITVRQLEAVVRISESLAKMRLDPFASERDVTEALRLFRVSTLDAALSGATDAPTAEIKSSRDALNEMVTIETKIKSRFPLGSRVSEAVIVDSFVKLNYPEAAVRKVIAVMLRRGELEHHMQRRVLYRIR